MHRLLVALLFLNITAPLLAQPEPRRGTPHRLRVHPDGHYLQTETGRPFFWLGDTCWELFHRLNRAEADEFLEIRRQQRFNVIQAVALAEFDGLNQPNAHGDLPLVNLDPTRPAVTPGSNAYNTDQYDYWDHVEYIVQRAADKGIYIALLPTWGDKVTKDWGAGPVVFNEQNARAYGEWIGRRFVRFSNVIWMLGGDRPATLTEAEATRRKREPYDHRPLWRAMAEGIQASLGPNVPMLMTYHTWGGGYRTSQEMGTENWLMVNTMQSGHGGGHDRPVWEWIEEDWNKMPTKPTLDAEPNYDDHPVNPWPKWDPANGYFNAHDVRKQTWRSVLAGGAGVTYGHHFIWQFFDPKRPPVNNGDTLIVWRQAARAEAAGQMQHLRNLIESRPQFNRIPDQSLLVSVNGRGGEHIRACRGSDGSYAFVYLPVNKPVTISFEKLTGKQITANWYDPRTGAVTAIGTFARDPMREFVPPETGQDWVLVLDDAGRNYGVPGKR